MKVLVVFAAFVTIAVAGPTKNVLPVAAGAAPIIGADQQPIIVGPAIIDSFEPIAVGPAIIDSFEPIAVGPVIVDSYEPIAVGPAIVDLNPAAQEEDSVLLAPAAQSPVLIQIILNINQNAAVPVFPSPVMDVPISVEPVNLVDNAEEIVAPVNVADSPQVPVESVNIGSPVFPVPAISLPDILN